MVLHLQLKIDDTLGGQVEEYLNQENILCGIKTSELDLLFEEQEKIAVPQILCLVCWKKINKTNQKQSKSITGGKTIPLPCEFNKLQSELKEECRKKESPIFQPSGKSINTYMSEFERYLSYGDYETKEKLKNFPHYIELSKLFLENESMSSTGFFSYPEEEARLKMLYIGCANREDGYFVFFINTIQPKLYKVIITSHDTRVFKMPCDKESIDNVLSMFVRESIREKEQSKLPAKSRQWFELPTVLAALNV